MDLRFPRSTPSVYGTELAQNIGLRRTPKASAPGFDQALQGALKAVSQAQNRAGDMQREVQLENPAVSLEQTMVALQKAQIGFQAALHVRNRLVQAYTDVMNMQV
ncbi:flagellar hook-basal body complex protein FliE [Comamonas composti]|uniref:flagellar hook-basal body complex protein FliE n=1 Tax=Comamonas composti TaxID=408558 RepID=UPI00042065E3|nr:flagellar hook-basal body complex protein FliE [Comamonas composti]